MEESLHGILYKYNNITKSCNLELDNALNSEESGQGMYYRLGDGTHSLKYRDYDILLIVQTISPKTNERTDAYREYQIITYNLDPGFVTSFERDMIQHRNSMLKIRSESSTINVYRDYHDGGFTYWEKKSPIGRRSLNTIYLPAEQKQLLVDTVNNFLSSKEYYQKNGIAHNLKILFHGPPSVGKDAAARCIASEYGRNIYYVTGGPDGRFIPDAITSNIDSVVNPLFLISDIDKYPFIINELAIDLDNSTDLKEKLIYKQSFAKMINALDGVLSGEDRIIIMTTNHIEKFSPVFLRPGRVDLILELNYVTPEVFRKYTFDFYGVELPTDISLKDKKLSVASLQFDVVFNKLTSNEFIKKYVK
jgi:chaperone BCS1